MPTKRSASPAEPTVTYVEWKDRAGVESLKSARRQNLRQTRYAVATIRRSMPCTASLCRMSPRVSMPVSPDLLNEHSLPDR
jgi:hypothetical protein